MLKGHVFSEQVFANECFAHFINLFLNKKSGITKGCNMTYTNNSVTVNAGYFCIQGRFLEVVGNNTLHITPNNEYCRLVCEIDLSQTNTETQFNQANFKFLTGSATYPTLTQQDLENGGNIYQFEFAQFQNTTNGITNFVDNRKFIDFDSIYSEIEEHIQNIDNGSLYLQKAGGTMTGKLIANGGIEGDVKGNLDGNAVTATSANTCIR